MLEENFSVRDAKYIFVMSWVDPPPLSRHSFTTGVLHKATMLLGFLLVSAAVCDASQNFSIPNVAASFYNTPKPFKINVDPKFIEDTRRRVEITRAPISIGNVDDGPTLDNFTVIKDYWVNEYNWEKTQESINQRCDSFRTWQRIAIPSVYFANTCFEGSSSLQLL